MLVSRLRKRPRDGGAALVAVVLVMLVGFIIAASVAASVMFTVTANAGNASRTQAFIAAESGRDAAYASLVNAIHDGTMSCTPSILTGGSIEAGGPQYTYAIRTTSLTDPQIAWDASNDVCPGVDTRYIVIQSTGTDGSASATIDSVYPWRTTPETQPAGTIAYFDGEFKATKSTYTGDLVIRGTGDYECNNGAGNELRGDLWILRADLRVTGDCIVTGNVYVFGEIDTKNKDFIVGGDVITMTGDISITANNAAVAGDIYSGGSITLTKSGTLGGELKAVGTITNPIPAGWKHEDGSSIVGQPGQPAPVISPTMQALYDATKWMEITSTTDWGTDVQNYSGLCDATALKAPLEIVGAPRALFDMTGCGNGGGKNFTLSLGNVNLQRDAVFKVPSGVKLTVNLDGTITKGAADPQLLIVQLDSDRNDIRPTCTGGSSFSLSGGSAVHVRTMLYSPCGIGSTTAITLTGQLYLGSDGIHLNGGTFTCNAMSWAPAFNNLGCGVRGEGGIFDPDRVRVSLESLYYQAEH